MLLNGGVPDASVLAASRGLHYGDGIFRTILVWNGVCQDWAAHMDKLASDAGALGLTPPDAETLANEAQALLGGQARGVLKILLWRRSAAGRGYAPATAQTDRLLLLGPAPAYDARHWQDGIQATISAVHLASQPQLAGAKHLNRLEQVLASRDWPEGVSEALMCDDRQQLVCGSRSNLFWVRDGEVHTASLDRCGVAGMMRARVIALCGTLSIPFALRSLPLAALAGVEEAFVTNSLIGIWPLRSVDQQHWTAPGPRTRQLMAALAHPRLES